MIAAAPEYPGRTTEPTLAAALHAHALTVPRGFYRWAFVVAPLAPLVWMWGYPMLAIATLAVGALGEWMDCDQRLTVARAGGERTLGLRVARGVSALVAAGCLTTVFYGVFFLVMGGPPRL